MLFLCSFLPHPSFLFCSVLVCFLLFCSCCFCFLSFCAHVFCSCSFVVFPHFGKLPAYSFLGLLCRKKHLELTLHFNMLKQKAATRPDAVTPRPLIASSRCPWPLSQRSGFRSHCKCRREAVSDVKRVVLRAHPCTFAAFLPHSFCAFAKGLPSALSQHVVEMSAHQQAQQLAGLDPPTGILWPHVATLILIRRLQACQTAASKLT